MVATTGWAGITLLLAAMMTQGLPTHEAQHVFGDDHQSGPINPLKHLSAISPFYIPTEQPTPLPDQCKLTRVSLLIRHSSILGNDDEYEETMEPFIKKIKKAQKSKKGRGKLPRKGDWAFLRTWKSHINDENLEVLSEQGKTDARDLGKYFRHQYDHLFPPPYKTGKNSTRDTYKVWTASSARDIDTAKAYINGSFPSHQSGDGSGDGDVVQLIQVPNHSKEPMGWEQTLTPHKACEAFDKKPSLKPANKWLSVYAPKIRKRLASHLPHFVLDLTDQDILAMHMLCGYESIATGDSPFCHVFTDNEWLDVEYYFDIRYHYMMGYGSELTPYLGAPWVKTARHLLEGEEGDAPGKHLPTNEVDEFDSKLPKPKLPPNATHTQFLHPHFTHRESPAFVAVFLNLFNDTSLPNPSSQAPPLDHRPSNRQWRTSHLVSFLGNIALERFECEDQEIYVRTLVNGREKVMGGCEDGLGGSCKWESWKQWIDERGERWGNWAGMCEKKKKD